MKWIDSRKVFVLLGITKDYSSTVQGTLEAIDMICNEPDVLIHLNKQTYDLEGYVVLGAKWSALEEEEIPSSLK
jgi:hypothetical protein